MFELDKVIETIDPFKYRKFPELTKKIINHILIVALTKIISNPPIKESIHQLFPGELARHAKLFGENVLKGKNKLVFSTSIVKNFFNGSEEDLIYLTATMEYLSAELIELSDSVAKYYEKVNVAPKYLAEAIKNDSELNELIFSNLGLSQFELSNIR